MRSMLCLGVTCCISDLSARCLIIIGFHCIVVLWFILIFSKIHVEQNWCCITVEMSNKLDFRVSLACPVSLFISELQCHCFICHLNIFNLSSLCTSCHMYIFISVWYKIREKESKCLQLIISCSWMIQKPKAWR